jgi:membrane protein implicated in regulation of membrane protease activity
MAISVSTVVRSVSVNSTVACTISIVRGDALVGRIGRVVIAVRGGMRPGEVRVVVEGIAHYYIAYAATPIPAGAEVLVINHRGARQVDVEPWPTMPEDGSVPGDPERAP